ncbi:Bug family tripartite tricarboxylate transporter substrate binding protein [Sabulicella glaciei]|uniref:Tripartite tricarboxylate transporter substrate binding protein n=1 Tax=Sabulicella glaciei TaxID=2984948 RepID=A0ABT3P1Q4_9PROT|nr:tripartite tricarboxylate transporter substrate binding protein [Roseococcus sp. MDT2-1-1]MCW8088326.1 tripartite tricarboxylate transporter substrate binding protein [Roseococcus sp. MDT2-1-1]
MRRMHLALTAVVTGLTLLAEPAQAQQPTVDPVRLLVGFPPGNASDLAARVLADGLQGRLGRPVTVENRVGGGGMVAAEAVARAVPDGTTLGVIAPLALAIARHTRTLPFDPQADFTPLSLFASAPMLVLVAPEHPARNLREMAEALRTEPDASCGSNSGVGHSLVAVLLVRSLRVACRHVPYPDPSKAPDDLRTGTIRTYVSVPPPVLSAVREGRVRVLAVAAPRPVAFLPGVPTVAETLPGFEAVDAWALLGPQRLPEALAARLERAAVEAARDAAAAARLRALGAEPVGSSATELAEIMRAEDARWGSAVRQAGPSSN